MRDCDSNPDFIDNIARHVGLKFYSVCQVMPSAKYSFDASLEQIAPLFDNGVSQTCLSSSSFW
jgi:hypothetical protein